MVSLSSEDPRIVLFASVPNQKDLCCISAFINPSEKHDTSAKSNYQWQILKCRQLIFSVPEIIASPVLGMVHEIHIIMRHEFKESGKLESHVEKLKLNINGPVPVTNSVYEACLRYTLIARIAPLWNQVGGYLLQSRDFLSVTSSMNAIKLDIGINDGEMFVAIWPQRVRMPHLKMEDLDVPTKISQDFLSQSTAAISDLCLGSQWVYVLPSLKKARVISISHQIPNSCPYRTYTELKRHWKNLYGYRLPEDDENLMYYTLFFHSSNPTFYTYPDVCVRPQSLIFLRRVDQMGVLRVFLNDLTRKLPVVCGQTFAVSPKLAYAVPKLQHLNEDMTRANLSNLPYMEPEFLSPSTVHSTQMEPNNSDSAPSEADMFGSQTSQYQSICSGGGNFASPTSESATTPVTEKDKMTKQRKSLPPTAANSPPLFHTQSIPTKSTSTLTPDNLKTQTRFVPIFKRQLYVPKCTQNDSLSLLGSQHRPYSVRNTTPALPLSVDVNTCDLLQNKEAVKPSFNSSMMSQVMFQNMKYGSHHHSAQQSKTTEPTVPPLKLKLVTSNLPKLPFVREFSLKREGPCSTTGDGCSENKKPRSRPQIQLDVDVEVLARNHDLARVNTATLVNWLRGKLVPCKVKDKKSDLVDKVMKYLNVSH